MKVAIVGSAMSKALAPFDDESWEIWGLAWRCDVPRATRWFEIHERKFWGDLALGKDYPGRLKALTAPVYMQQRHDDVPASVAFPTSEVDAFVSSPTMRFDWRTSSISYMLALAIWEMQCGGAAGQHQRGGAAGQHQLAVYGVDMALVEEEYIPQRPAIEHLLGLARGLGILVTIPEGSSLCKANFVYGVQDTGGAASLRATGITEEILDARLASYEKQKREVQENMVMENVKLRTLDGAMQEAASLREYIRLYNKGGVLPNMADSA